MTSSCSCLIRSIFRSIPSSSTLTTFPLKFTPRKRSCRNGARLQSCTETRTQTSFKLCGISTCWLLRTCCSSRSTCSRQDSWQELAMKYSSCACTGDVGSPVLHPVLQAVRLQLHAIERGAPTLPPPLVTLISSRLKLQVFLP